jgi:hypothetical protein
VLKNCSYSVRYPHAASRFSDSCRTPRALDRRPVRVPHILLTLQGRVILIGLYHNMFKGFNLFFFFCRLHPLPRNYGESRNRKMTQKEFSTWMIIRCGEILLGVRPVSNAYCNYVGSTPVTNTVSVCLCSCISYPACKAHAPYNIAFCGLSSSITFFPIITWTARSSEQSFFLT